MAFQPAPDTAEAAMNYELQGQPQINRMNFEHAGGYNQTDIDLLAQVIDLAVSNYLIPRINSGVNYLFTHVRGLASQIDLEAINSTSTEAGAATGAGLPGNVSYTVKLGTGATGRSARGRWYMIGMVEPQLLTLRTVESTYANACVDAIADLITAAATAGWNAVITSRQQNNVVLTTAQNRVITDIIASNLNVDTQRRRVGK